MNKRNHWIFWGVLFVLCIISLIVCAVLSNDGNINETIRNDLQSVASALVPLHYVITMLAMFDLVEKDTKPNDDYNKRQWWD
jgi:undecaprenyl pyrophosphate phosphatase UppP